MGTFCNNQAFLAISDALSEGIIIGMQAGVFIRNGASHNCNCILYIYTCTHNYLHTYICVSACACLYIYTQDHHQRR